jgi:hypothetical protein
LSILEHFRRHPKLKEKFTIHVCGLKIFEMQQQHDDKTISVTTCFQILKHTSSDQKKVAYLFINVEPKIENTKFDKLN